ncbi:MAG TPA: SDR family NAD(P)-dependent oxidoreductase [Drouetiella sp.]|jgi:short-subunit dehydrogenase
MKPVCLIVGAGEGISFSAANQFIERGYQIALVSRTEQKLLAIADKLQSGREPGTVSTWVADVADHIQLAECIKSLSGKLGGVSVLIYNAYALAAGRGSNLKPEVFENSLKVNVGSALLCAQLVIPSMKSAGAGTIIFTGGGYALSPVVNMVALSVGKAGLRALAKCLFDELKGSGIHAGTVTICGTVKPDTAFDPVRIARVMMQFHEQKPEEYEWEVVFDGVD